MARVGLIREQDHPELSELMTRIRGARRGRLINVYRLLLHSPALAEAWFALNNAVRWQTRIDARLRELVIIRIAHLCRAPYVLRQHVPGLAEAEGVSMPECDALANWRNSGLFSNRERAALAYADAVTENSSPDEVMAELSSYFDQRQLVELTVLIGAYNMHARVLNALELDLEKPEAES